MIGGTRLRGWILAKLVGGGRGARELWASSLGALELGVDLLGGAVGCAAEDSCVGGKGERDLCKAVYAHACSDGDGDYLNDLDSAFAYYVAA